MSLPASFDPERPIVWQPGGYSPTLIAAEQQRSGMFEFPPETRCKYCKEPLRSKHGVTPRGTTLGWLLRGRGPWCYWDNHQAWQAWKRGLYYGKTELNGW